jgi:hypothetical protein
VLPHRLHYLLYLPVGYWAHTSDRNAVQSLFKMMTQAYKEISPSFQLIALDHAHLRDDWFQATIDEEWRGENALIPYEWPSKAV